MEAFSNPTVLVENRIFSGHRPVNRSRAASSRDDVIASGSDCALVRENTAQDKISGMAASARKLSMVQVDVFTDRALTGNALAVVLDGRALSTEQMQAL